MLDKLNKMFVERYSKQLQTLNQNVFKAAKDDAGNYEVPIWALKDGGLTVAVGATGEIKLAPPAKAGVANCKVKSKQIFYRVYIPLAEAEIAANKPEYFNHVFDRVLGQALINYEKVAGPAAISRFGDVYITTTRAGGRADQPLIMYMPTVESGNAEDGVEFQLYGNFATEELV